MGEATQVEPAYGSFLRASEHGENLYDVALQPRFFSYSASRNMREDRLLMLMTEFGKSLSGHAALRQIFSVR